MRWSNDELKSTLHRVVAPKGDETETPERFSIPYVGGYLSTTDSVYLRRPRTTHRCDTGYLVSLCDGYN